MDKGNYKLLQSRELEVARRASKDGETLTSLKRIGDPLVRVFIVPTSRAIIIVLIIPIVRKCTFQRTILAIELNGYITIPNVFSSIIISVNRNDSLDVHGNWTDVTLC